MPPPRPHPVPEPHDPPEYPTLHSVEARAEAEHLRRIQHLLLRVREDVAKAELCQAAYDEGKAKWIKERPERNDPESSAVKFQNSPWAKNMNATGEWAWRRAVGYATAFQVELEAYRLLTASEYLNPRRSPLHRTLLAQHLHRQRQHRS